MLTPPAPCVRSSCVPALARSLLLALSLASLLTGCDARVREIRSRLSDQQRVLFDRGARLSGPCWACHDFYGTQNKVGPYLSGIYGRRAGSSTFGAYSDALRATGVVWDDRTLDAFLASPQRFAPGTTMVSPGLESRADREALLFYMQQVTRPGG